MNQLAERYGTALFELAMENNKIDEWQKQGKLIQSSLTEEMDKFFNSYQISNEEKKNVLLKAFSTHLDSTMLDFLCLLIDTHRFMGVSLILSSFNTMCNEAKKIKEGLVYSARPLTLEQVHQIEEAMENRIHSKCELTNRIDERLISGFRVVIDNEVVDSSMKNRIASMKSELIKGTR